MAADFTMLLRDVVDVTGGDWGVETYPIFDEAYRKQLNQTLYEIYCYREIGFETIDIFRQQVAAAGLVGVGPGRHVHRGERIVL